MIDLHPLILRKDFPFFEANPDLVYLDSAATAQKVLSVIEVMSRFYLEEYATVHRSVYELAARATERYNQVRGDLCRFLGSLSPDEIIFTRGTTEAINLVANSFGEVFIKEGDEILISEMEHHSNIVPWQMLCERKKANLKIIPVNERCEILLDAYEKLLTPRTKLVSIAHVSNVAGTINPIEEMIESAHKKGAKVFIDGAQSAVHLPIDVQALNADFFAFSAHKAFGPNAVGALYGKKELLDIMPPFMGGGDMIDKVTWKKTSYRTPPLRFEAGTPMIAEVIGFGEAIRYIENLDRVQLMKWEKNLLNYATEKLLSIPKLRLIGEAQNKAPIISFVIEGVHSLDLATLLDLEGICMRSGHLCAQMLMQRFGISSAARISFAAYNTLEEIDYFIGSLQRILKSLKSK